MALSQLYTYCELLLKQQEQNHNLSPIIRAYQITYTARYAVSSLLTTLVYSMYIHRRKRHTDVAILLQFRNVTVALVTIQ